MNTHDKPIYFNMRFINATLPHFGSQTLEARHQSQEEGDVLDTGFEFVLNLDSEQIHLLLGDSGSGKSTLMRCIAGFKNFSSGRIDLQGRRVAMLLQNPFHQIIMQKVYDELFFPQKNAGITTKIAQEEIARVCDILEITHLLNRNMNTLSFGETQLIMIAATVLTPAEIYLFDEPTSHLDPPHIAKFYALLAILAKDDKTILVSTQNSDEYHFVDRILVLEKGQLKADYSQMEMSKIIEEGTMSSDVILIKKKLEELK